MTQSLYLEWNTPTQAGNSMRGSFIPWVKDKLDQGLCLAVQVSELEDARTLQQNRFYWGVVLKEISEQAKINGTGATADGWHYYFKRRVLGYKFSKVRVPGQKRPSVTRELRSTRGLSVKKMGAYLDEVQAIAATELGVAFSGMRWQDHRGES